MSSTISPSVIQYIKSILARHGIPEKFLTMVPYYHQWPLPSLLWIMAFTTTLVAPITPKVMGKQNVWSKQLNLYHRSLPRITILSGYFTRQWLLPSRATHGKKALLSHTYITRNIQAKPSITFQNTPERPVTLVKATERLQQTSQVMPIESFTIWQSS